MNKVLLIFLFIFFFTLPLFAQSVDTAWVRRYNGPGNTSDWPSAIAVDASCNVYVTGTSYKTSEKYYATIKYYPSGDTAWVRRYNGPGNDEDWALAIAVDDSSYVYVTGWSSGNGTSTDYATIKYDAFGNELWVMRYNGLGNGEDVAWAMEVNASSNVYVTGKSEGSGTSYDFTTIRYYPNGDTAWVRRYNGPGNDYDWALAIAVDDFGNVYVTGRSYGSGTYEDYATIRYDSSANELWVQRYNGPGNGWDEASDIAVDGSGNVYVTGGSVGAGTAEDYATIRYYPSGDTAWVRRYNGPGNDEDWAFDVEVDGSGNVYVTGRSHGGETYIDYATIKYDSSGNELWIKRYSGPGAAWDGACAIEVDVYGNVYVTGQSYGDGTYNDYATIKYDSLGNEVWVKKYDGPVSGIDVGRDMALDSSDNVYVTGFSQDSWTACDYATIKYVQFLRGDVNADGVVDIGDVVYLINYLYRDGPPPVPISQVGDVNCDGVVDLGDVLYLINYLYKNGPPPCS